LRHPYLARRPRIRNVLHLLGILNPETQTETAELGCLANYAAGALIAVEIGSFEGVSAAVIAESMDPEGMLYCIDPWPNLSGRPSPSLSIFERHLRRRGLSGRVRLLRGDSMSMASAVPDSLDFMFIDGDHSWEGIRTDWDIAKKKLRSGGTVCLHDSLVPVSHPTRLDSARFYESVICKDSGFVSLPSIGSLAVLRRL
jgi:predicted O-methyltransferase YrrM